MAVRRSRSSRKRSRRKKGVSPAMAFLLLLFIGIIVAFLVLLPKARNGISLNLPQRSKVTEQPEPSFFEQSDPEPPVRQPERPPVAQVQEQPKPPPGPEGPGDPVPEAPPRKPVEQPPPPTPPPSRQPEPGPPVSQPPPVSPPERKPVETRDRTIYFMREGSGGNLQPANVSRKLEVSDSPLTDALAALLAGPSADERNRGIISFIPSGTRILSARVSNNTVFLNFNEEFRYNTFGREGGEAQLKQIVWTATEFPNVNNVQIMIEGNIVDFLMEGITVRNPIGR